MVDTHREEIQVGEAPVEMTARDFTEFAVRIRGKPIDLTRRPWLHQIYDQPFEVDEEGEYRRKQLMVFGRQCEKCLVEDSPVYLLDRGQVPIKDVEVGDVVATLSSNNSRLERSRVVWKSAPVHKQSFRITTKMGHVIEAGSEHPFRTWGGWTPAEDLRVGSRVASVRRLPHPENTETVSRLDILLLALFTAPSTQLTGDGKVSILLQRASPLAQEVLRECRVWATEYKARMRRGKASFRCIFPAEGSAARKYHLWGMGHGSLPDWALRLPAAQVAFLINRMFAANNRKIRLTGPRKNVYLIEYLSESEKLCLQVQRLLWRCRVPTSLSRGLRYRSGAGKYHKLAVQTRGGVLNFLRNVGVLGQSERMPVPDVGRSKMDTFPLEIGEELRAISEQRLDGAPLHHRSFHSAGLKKKLTECPSRPTLEKYVHFFRDHPGTFDQLRVDKVAEHLDTDLLWDEVLYIEHLGVRTCYDIEVLDTHNFVASGLITHNSTTIGNMLLSMSCIEEYLRSLYISASDIQMREFSDERLRAVIEDSPYIKAMTRLDGKTTTQNVQTKTWNNFSKIALRSVYRSADRVRGLSVDNLGLDEIQDILTDTLPVIEETQFASDLEGGPIALYAGTPKTFDNALENYWSRHSTQNEWLVRCEGCNHYNTIEIENVQPDGLVCIRCSKLLDPIENGLWVRMGRQGAQWEGWRVPQPVVIYAHAHKDAVFRRKWKDLIIKKGRYGRPKFQNEVMARSYDSGTKPVTYDEVRRCALGDREMILPEELTNQLRATPKWAGIDWGSGDGSYTILSIWYYDHNGRFSLMYCKRYEGVEADSDFSIEDIIKTLKAFRVNKIGADWGFGFHANPRLQKAFGAANVILYAHLGSQKEKVKFDKTGFKFTTHRTRVLADVFTLIKTGPNPAGIAFTKWGEFETFANDILSVYQDYNEKRRELVFDHPRDHPDDFLHTICYALLVSQFDHRRPDLHAPNPGQRPFSPR